MKDRWISRVIAIFCIIESFSGLVAIGMLAFVDAIRFKNQIVKEETITVFALCVLISMFFAVYFCYYSFIQDWCLLKATKKGKDAGEAVDLCKSWLRLTNISFSLKFIALLFLVLFKRFYSNLLECHFNFFNCTGEISVHNFEHFVVLVLFPAPTCAAFSLLWTSPIRNFLFLRFEFICWIFLIVLLRSCSLTYVKKFNNNLKETIALTTSDPITIQVEFCSSCRAETIITNIPAEKQGENSVDPSLPSYEDATNPNPPSYDAICDFYNKTGV